MMRKILIIDDDLRHDKMMSYLLLSKGFEPSYALSGEEAIKKLASGEFAKPVIILMDIMMPGLSGFETMAQLKKNPELSDIPVIMVSAISDREQQDKAKEIGATEYIEKPFSPSVVIECIYNILDKDIGDA
ncbi:MAG: response regulator [Deltaproteobacteria bacterium]|nr:response regulator [Deltaproteobacteria bacterium]